MMTLTLHHKKWCMQMQLWSAGGAGRYCRNVHVHGQFGSLPVHASVMHATAVFLFFRTYVFFGSVSANAAY